jgi:hypothetical protein
MKAQVQLENRKDGAAVTVSVKEEKLQHTQTESAMGEEFIPMQHKGKETYIAVSDLENDGFEEFFVRVAFPSQGGALWLFRWEANKKRFSLVPHGEMDFIPVDYAAPVKIDAKNKLELHIFRLQKGKKVLVKEHLKWNGSAYAK